MNNSYRYLLPVVLLAIAFGVSTFLNNQFILSVGGLISLIWLNRVAVSLENKSLKIITTILLIGGIIWVAALLLWASSW